MYYNFITLSWLLKNESQPAQIQVNVTEVQFNPVTELNRHIKK